MYPKLYVTVHGKSGALPQNGTTSSWINIIIIILIKHTSIHNLLKLLSNYYYLTIVISIRMDLLMFSINQLDLYILNLDNEN